MQVYRIVNAVNGKCYVGSTIRTSDRRFREHCSNARRGKQDSVLYAAMRKHGVEAFSVETIAVADSYEHLMTLEIEAIAANGCVVPSGYNIVKGGRGDFGWTPSDETRAKMRAKKRGYIPWNKGRESTPEERARMSMSRKGAVLTDRQLASRRTNGSSAESRAKISAAATIRWAQLSPEKRAVGVARLVSCVAAAVESRRSPESRRRASDAKRKWWASLTPEQRAQHVAAMRCGSRTAGGAAPPRPPSSPPGAAT
jgi:group I intron endonuclease